LRGSDAPPEPLNETADKTVSQLMTRTTAEAVIARLKSLLGERLSTSAAVRENHGRDLTWHEPHAPDAVAFPVSTEEVAGIVTICAESGTPVIPYGAGTSLEGHIAALEGGVCIDLSRMDQILAVNTEDLDAVVQPGVTRKRLNEYLRDTGLFFPIDPGADASIGGMAATRASGTNAVRYGTMRENVLALTVVLPNGHILHTGGRARKSSAGYDLTRLFVGSEGTLGVITEVTVRLYGLPEAMSSAICAFDNIEGAVDTVISTIQSGIPIARIELLDEVQIDAINRYSKLSYPLKPTLLLEFHGTSAAVAEQADRVQALAQDNGGQHFQWTAQEEERKKLWQARHDAYFAALALRPGAQGWISDVCVPISRLADCIRETKADLAGTYLKAPLVGHVGDGNFHLIFLVDRTRPEEIAEAVRLNDRLVMRAIAMGGTSTGEHGIGSGKMKYLPVEHGAEGALLMSLLKRAVDPKNIMNPGKVVAVT
jgi:D-lactate dehydrogenase (cytochrome)